MIALSIAWRVVAVAVIVVLLDMAAVQIGRVWRARNRKNKEKS